VVRVSKVASDYWADVMSYFRIVLLIKHPNIDPGFITSKLKLEPFSTSKAGEPRRTPKGTSLPGTWQDSSWNHIFKYEGDVRLFDEIERLLGQLSLHKDLFHKITSEGGHAEIYSQLPGEIHHGSSATPSLLMQIAELGLHLGVEVFPDWGEESVVPSKGVTKSRSKKRRSAGKRRQ